MNQSTDLLDRMQVAAPCDVNWDRMSGDERVRLCKNCGLHVYNISSMTRAEAMSLISNTEGRICVKIYRRTDGTLLTKDCPTGIRAVRKRVARVVSAGFAVALSLCSIAIGQTRKQDGKADSGVEFKVKRTSSDAGRSVFRGTVTDQTKAMVAGAKVTLTNEQTEQKVYTTTTAEGEFSLSELSEGNYSIRVESPGFKLYEVKHFSVKAKEEVEIVAVLQTGEGLIGVFIEMPPVEIKPGEKQTIGDTVEKLPLR